MRNQVVKEAVELPFIGRQLTATSDFNPTTHIAGGVDPGVTQAIKAAHAMRDLATGQAHILALKATWDPLWEEYLMPRWRRQRLGLHRAQEHVIGGFCKKAALPPGEGCGGVPGKGCFSQGGWKAGVVREGTCKVVEQLSRPSTDDRPDRLVIVDEFRTSRVSLSVHARQPCELHLSNDRTRPTRLGTPSRPGDRVAAAPSLEPAACSVWCHQVPPNPPPPPPAEHPPAQDPPPPPPAKEPLPPPAQDQPPLAAPDQVPPPQATP
ncbi:hypothetical protein QJQ45_019679 [Haematococcus lacustris]|nr:hypothetical protein QJQ45_019679 [Haematococcus lacustris]